jgi:threonine/homoserine/homoserine lactone efflux protein
VVELALVVGLALGLNRLLDNDAVAATVGLVGGLFLLWLGWQAIRTPLLEEVVVDRKSVVGGAPPAPAGGGAFPISAAGGLAAMGAAASVANPFWVVWWVTIGAAYVLTALDQGAAGVASFYTAHFLTDLGWLSLIAFALATGRGVISGRVYRGVLIACGVFLVGLGTWFLTSAVGYVV